MFNNNHENMTERLSKGQKITFKRRELINKKRYKLIMLACLLSTFISFTSYFNPKKVVYCAIFFQMVSWSIIVANIWNTIKLLGIMKTNHHFEYERSKIYVLAFTCQMILILLIESLYNLVEVDTGLNIPTNKTAFYKKHLWFFKVKEFLFSILGLVECLFILKFKRSDDLLQGISKLDNIIKVSCFQIYKNKNVNM